MELELNDEFDNFKKKSNRLKISGATMISSGLIMGKMIDAFHGFRKKQNFRIELVNLVKQRIKLVGK